MRWFSFLSILLLLLVGCSKVPVDGQPGGSAPAVVSVWHSLQGAEADALEAQIQAFAKANAEVIVELKYIPEQNFVTLSFQAEAGGEGPEIFIASREIIRKLYEKGVLAKVAYTDPENFPAAIAGFRFGGTEFALPWLTDVPLLYFRSDTATIPANLGELFSAKGGISIPSSDTATLSALWNGQGGHLMNAGNPVLDNSSNVAFLQQLSTWRETQLLRVDPTALTSFEGGQIPYVIAGASYAKTLTQHNIPWGSMPLTDLMSGQGQPLLGATLGIANSSIKTTTEMTPAIQSVEKALLTPEVEGSMMQAGHLIPANMGYYRLQEAQSGVYLQANAALSKAWVLEGNALEWDLIPLQDDAWEKVLAGNFSPQDALASAQAQAVQVLSTKK